MNKCNSIIRLNGKNIDGNNACCLGIQLVLILEAIYESIKDSVWVVSDLDDNCGISSELFPNNDFKICIISNTNELLLKIRKVNQFYSGVFIAIGRDIRILPKSIPETDAEEGIQIEESVLEIRAFDTSYFEVYSNAIIVEILKQKFKIN